MPHEIKMALTQRKQIEGCKKIEKWRGFKYFSFQGNYIHH